MERRTQIIDKQNELELQTWNLFPERWGELYREKSLGLGRQSAGDIGSAFNGEPEMPVTDYDDLNSFFNTMSEKRGINGEQAIKITEQQTDYSRLLGRAEGEGRRV